MSWHDLSPQLRTEAERVCTPKELLVLKHRLDGYSWNRIADGLTISKSAARERYRNAARKLHLPEEPE